jgi:hypothetical protein
MFFKINFRPAGVSSKGFVRGRGTLAFLTIIQVEVSDPSIPQGKLHDAE